MWPLVITVKSVKQELSGKPVMSYLLKLAAVEATTAEQKVASVNTQIAEAIQEAQGDYETLTGNFLTQRRVRTIPVEPKTDGEPQVPGIDYDWEEEGYNYIREDWEQGFADIKVRHRPLIEIDRVVLRYGQTLDAVKALNLPEQWQIKNRKLGIVHIVPIIGLGPFATSSLTLLAVAGANLAGHNNIPNIVTIDYTAGFLPRDFNVETDDPTTACRFEDMRPILAAVRFNATARVLTRMQRAVSLTGGTISIDGVSQSIQPGFFDSYIKTYEEKFQAAVNQTKRPGLKFTTL
jgi:hypothetical protein